MKRQRIPTWCHQRIGKSAILIIAPHGGRRSVTNTITPTTPPARINDLYTADLAVRLADELNASLIVNTFLDRNQVDLNRISQVAARAPWFVDLIDSLLAQILRRHATAEILFIHGWNIVQSKCDVGVGARLSDDGAARRPSTALTVSPQYISRRLQPFSELCQQANIRVVYGERYPARHPNNVVQLFRHAATAEGRHQTPWPYQDRLQAVQLELGIPIRWARGDARSVRRGHGSGLPAGKRSASGSCALDARGRARNSARTNRAAVL